MYVCHYNKRLYYYSKQFFTWRLYKHNTEAPENIPMLPLGNIISRAVKVKVNMRWLSLRPLKQNTFVVTHYMGLLITPLYDRCCYGYFVTIKILWESSVPPKCSYRQDCYYGFIVITCFISYSVAVVSKLIMRHTFMIIIVSVIMLQLSLMQLFNRYR